MNSEKEIYFAIIGDIIDSREIDNRNDVQKLYVKMIYQINKNHKDDIASKFIITLGDSFQGLLKNSKDLFKIIEEIEEAMAPYQLRFGIGVGEINTTIILKDSSLIDGPAYHYARFAINDAKTLTNKNKGSSSIIVHSDNIILDNLINSAISMCNVLKSSWTTKQKKVIDLAIKKKKTQVEIAHILNIKQPSVNSRLRSSNINIYTQALENINKSFELYLGKEK
ncbi:MAG: SatD family protein [Sphaerochaetaceae bacterium]|nr:SatD family protein [Sphaerochaetaceae bacterium]